MGALRQTVFVAGDSTSIGGADAAFRHTRLPEPKGGDCRRFREALPSAARFRECALPVFPFHELRRAAWNLASGNVRPGEDVLVVASSDQEPALVDALVAAADAAGAGTATAAVIACPADMADYRHPPPVIAAAERAGLIVVATSIRFPRAYDDLSRALFAAGRRQVLINNAPLENFVRGAALADPDALLARTRRLAGAVSGARTVRVVSPNGTDLTVRVCRPCLPLTGFAEEDTGFGSFPSGEAMLSPEKMRTWKSFRAASWA
ncbi:MAG: hypothetical protein OXH14_05220, partial [Alphaproteobacteria bacterium]|nr:hypothetical protein [Alphaproteobacteria bacterium]